MRKPQNYLLTLLIIISTYSISRAQFTKSIQLKPILKSGRSYFYDTKRMNNAYSLQIPLEALENEEVDRYFKKFKTLQRVKGLSYVPALVFLIASSNQTITGTSQSDGEAFFYLILGGIAADVTLGMISHHQIGKAIDIYNVAIAEHSSINLNLNKPVSGGTIMNIGFRRRF